MLYIRLSDVQKTKNNDGALEKNVDYQFEFPRQCIVQKNALSLTQAPMGTKHPWVKGIQVCFYEGKPFSSPNQRYGIIISFEQTCLLF